MSGFGKCGPLEFHWVHTLRCVSHARTITWRVWVKQTTTGYRWLHDAYYSNDQFFWSELFAKKVKSCDPGLDNFNLTNSIVPGGTESAEVRKHNYVDEDGNSPHGWKPKGDLVLLKVSK